MEVASIPKHATCEVVIINKIEWSIRMDFHMRIGAPLKNKENKWQTLIF